MTTLSTMDSSAPISLIRDPTARALEKSLFGYALGEEPRPALVSCDLERAYRLADRVFALREPWRGRFVDYIAFRATGEARQGQRPPRAQLAVWLTNERLHRLVWELLHTWTGEA